MKKLMLGAAAGAILVVAAAPALAHHSAAMFDMEKPITLSGVVKDFQYTNPHSWLVVIVVGFGAAALFLMSQAPNPQGYGDLTDLIPRDGKF